MNHKRISLALTLIVTLVVQNIFAQSLPNLNQGEIVQKDFFVSLPYTVLNGKVILEASVNGKKHKFILDTGAPFSISGELYKELQSASLGSIQAADQSGAKDSLRVVNVPEITIGDVTITNTPAIVPKRTEIVFGCFGVDGFIGSNMLRNMVVQFDSRNKLVLFTSDPDKLALDKNNAIDMQLSPSQSNPYIKVTLQKGKGTAIDNILFDSGADGFYEMGINQYKVLSEKTKVLELVAQSTGSYTAGLYGVSEAMLNYAVKIPGFRLGKMTFNDVVTKTTYAGRSRIGSELFGYGKVTLDYKNKLFYLEPYDGLDTKSVYEKMWPLQPVIEKNKMVIGIVWDKSLLGKINPGDEILSFNGINYQQMSICEIITVNRKSANNKATITLKDAKTGDSKTFDVEKM